jgi:hypothetical protein
MTSIRKQFGTPKTACRKTQQREWPSGSETSLSLKALEIDVEIRRERIQPDSGDCPYFKKVCPFAESQKAIANPESDQAKSSGAVYAACCADPVHRKLHSFECKIEPPLVDTVPPQHHTAAAN